jgi:threonine/homoserine/homoserine lactone efflux protein
VNTESFIGLFLTTAVLAATPGPGVMATVGEAIKNGFRSGLLVTLGIVAANLIFISLVFFGLSIIASKFGAVFLIIKLVAGGYLIYLGVRMWRRQPGTDDENDSETTRVTGFGPLMQGFIITLSYPKLLFFYTGYLSAFIDTSNFNIVEAFLAIGATSLALLLILAPYAYLASRLRKLFSNESYIRNLNRLASAIIVAAGLLVIVSI